LTSKTGGPPFPFGGALYTPVHILADRYFEVDIGLHLGALGSLVLD
jgi:hypothetical protein